MNQTIAGRRRFLRHSALALAVPVLPMHAWAQTVPLRNRLEWQAFKVTPQYDSLIRAVQTMKANTNSADPNSWNYWTNVHLNYCPHGVAYFLAWHRGYLYYFENQLRSVSKDSSLVLPYWDYYSYATLPAEFTNNSGTNPLYVSRVNTNVRQALTLAPFGPTILNFPRGYSNAFEPSLEDAPHNPVHNIIGNIMATMQSPIDPIFWLHHANIDRLWVAWVAAGAGRKMPSQRSSYWSGSHVYSSTLSMARKSTYDTRTVLQYKYQNETMPATLPLAQLSAAEVQRVQAGPNDVLRTIPATGSFRVNGPHANADGTYSVGGALQVGLTENSITAQMPVDPNQWAAIQTISTGVPATIAGSSMQYRSVDVVLDDVEVTSTGKKGGYFYVIYLNVPSAGSSRPVSIRLGTVGPFEVDGAFHHGHGSVQLRYTVPRGALPPSTLRVGMISVSFARVDGDKSPRGAALGIGEVRLELSPDDKGS